MATQITEEMRLKQMRELGEERRSLYGSIELGDQIREIAEQHNLSEQLHKALIDIVGDVILGFFALQDFPTLVQSRLQIDQNEVQLVSKKLMDLLATTSVWQSQPAGTQNQPQQALPPSLQPAPQPQNIAPQQVYQQPVQSQQKAPQQTPAPLQAPAVQRPYQPQVGYAKPEPEVPRGAPSYRKPLTGTPRYAEQDPYHEDTGKGDASAQK